MNSASAFSKKFQNGQELIVGIINTIYDDAPAAVLSDRLCAGLPEISLEDVLLILCVIPAQYWDLIIDIDALTKASTNVGRNRASRGRNISAPRETNSQIFPEASGNRASLGDFENIVKDPIRRFSESARSIADDLANSELSRKHSLTSFSIYAPIIDYLDDKISTKDHRSAFRVLGDLYEATIENDSPFVRPSSTRRFDSIQISLEGLICLKVVLCNALSQAPTDLITILECIFRKNCGGFTETLKGKFLRLRTQSIKSHLDKMSRNGALICLYVEALRHILEDIGDSTIRAKIDGRLLEHAKLAIFIVENLVESEDVFWTRNFKNLKLANFTSVRIFPRIGELSFEIENYARTCVDAEDVDQAFMSGPFALIAVGIRRTFGLLLKQGNYSGPLTSAILSRWLWIDLGHWRNFREIHKADEVGEWDLCLEHVAGLFPVMLDGPEQALEQALNSRSFSNSNVPLVAETFCKSGRFSEADSVLSLPILIETVWLGRPWRHADAAIRLVTRFRQYSWPRLVEAISLVGRLQGELFQEWIRKISADSILLPPNSSKLVSHSVSLVRRTDEEIIDELSTRLGQKVWRKLDQLSRDNIVKAEHIYTDFRFIVSENRQDTNTWVDVVSLYASTVEREASRVFLSILEFIRSHARHIKNSEVLSFTGDENPTLGTFAKLVKFLYQHRDDTSSASIGLRKWTIAKNFQSSGDVDSFYTFVSLRNRAMHGAIRVSILEVVALREILFADGLLKRIVNISRHN